MKRGITVKQVDGEAQRDRNEIEREYGGEYPEAFPEYVFRVVDLPWS